MRRHALLLGAALVLVALAGCSASASLSMHPAPNDTAVAESATTALEELDSEDARLARGAIDGTDPTATGEHPPFEPSRPIAADGAYYNLTWSVVDTREEQEYSLEFDMEPSNTTGRTIDYGDLPAVDRRIVPGPDSPAVQDGDDIGSMTVYNESQRERSVLVPELEYELVRIGDRTVRITSHGSTTITIKTYQYAARQVADSPAALAERLLAEHLFTLSNLSSAERDIVDGAIGDSQYAESDSEDGWADLTTRFQSQDPVYGSYDTHGEYLVRYNGSVYWADFSSYIDPATE